VGIEVGIVEEDCEGAGDCDGEVCSDIVGSEPSVFGASEDKRV
jgi:hypothetical protein